MRATAALVGACLVAVAVAVAGCSSTSEQALSPAQEAKAALASGSLAWQQYVHDRTLPPTTITTLQDMLAAISDAESELTELPATDDGKAADALRAVRKADDAVASALSSVTTGRGTAGIGDLLKVATQDLDSSIGALQ